MSVETAPTANSTLVKKEETPKAELKHCRIALVDRNTRWCCCTLTRIRVTRAERAEIMRRAKAAKAKTESAWIRQRLLGDE